MRVLVIGASGFLGKKVLEVFSQKYTVVGTYSSAKEKGLRKLDITKKYQIRQLLQRHKPQLIIHPAGITDVDLCETNQELAYAVNIQGTENLLEYYHGRVVYVSTDFVFSGEKGNYREDDKPDPINFYGYTKAESEKVVQDSGNPYIIARVAVLYGLDPKNKKFVNWAISQLRQKKQVRAVEDHVRTPTLIDDIAQAISVLAEQNRQGIFHVAGPQKLSSHEMALRIAQHFGFSKSLLKPVKAETLGQDAIRPKDSSLDTNLIKRIGIKMSSFDQGIEKIKGGV